MNPTHRIFLFLAIFLMVSCTPAACAFSVTGIAIDPAGYPAAGTTVKVNYTVDFASITNITFPEDSELRLSTGLVHPSWTSVLVVDGAITRLPPQTGESAEIPGWYISFPSHQSVQLQGTVTGTMPANPSAAKDFLNVQEIDAATRIVSTARVAMESAPEHPRPVLPTDMPTTRVTITKPAFTPIPTDTPSQDPPTGILGGILAAIGAAFCAIRRQ